LWPFKPSVPDITHEENVVNWFLKYDSIANKINETFPPENIKIIKQSILKDVLENDTLEKLNKTLSDVEEKHTLALTQMALLTMKSTPLNHEETLALGTLGFDEVYYFIELRILGYFLLKKFGVDLQKR
jgi:hypothetical protein